MKSKSKPLFAPHTSLCASFKCLKESEDMIMAFDGIVVANLARELRRELLNGRIAKIAQPEADELLLTVKTPAGQKRLVLSASASSETYPSARHGEK